MRAPTAIASASDAIAHSLQEQARARSDDNAVHDRDHSGCRQCQLPGAGCEPLAVQHGLFLLPADDNDIRLELRHELQIEVTQAPDPLCVGDVLDRGLDQTLKRKDADERQRGQQDQRKRVERRTEPRHLSDKGERDQVGGQCGEEDARSTVRLRNGDRASGL